MKVGASLTIHSDRIDHDLNKLSNQDYLINEVPAEVLFLKAKYMFGSVQSWLQRAHRLGLFLSFESLQCVLKQLHVLENGC